jgi:TRAP-type C4-dicarboxylate transport system permease small subunit
VFNNSIAWADEMARFSFIWVNLLAIIFVFQNDELIKLDMISVLIARKRGGRYFLEITEFLIISFILALLTFYSFKFISVMSHVSATLALPMKVIYGVLPFSMSCMFIGNVIKFINLINRNRNL